MPLFLCRWLIASIVCFCGCLTSIVVEPENYGRWQVMKLSSLLQNMLSLHLLAELTSLLLPCACVLALLEGSFCTADACLLDR